MSDPPKTDQHERTRPTQPQDSRAAADDSETLATLVEEARLDHDRALTTLEAIDDRAMRSVRTALLVLGFVVSAVGIAGPAAVGAAPFGIVLLLVFGVGALLAATLRGICVSTVTVHPRSLSTPRHGTSRGATAYSTEMRLLLERYDAMARRLSDRIEASTGGLARVQRGLVVGTALLAVAAGAFVLSEGYGVDGNVAATFGVAALLAVRFLDDCPVARG